MAGFYYVWKNAGLQSFLICLTIISFFVMPFVALLPFYLEDMVHCGPEWYGYLMALFGMGAIAGFFLVNTPLLPSEVKAALLVIFVVMTPAGLLLIAFLPVLYFVVFSFLLLGIMQGFLVVKMVTAIQVSTESRIRGRVLGLFEAVTHGLSAVAMVFAGTVADLTGRNIQAVMIFCGSMGTGLSIVVFLNRKLRTSFMTLSKQ
jgi:MFS transporter, DHA3 family, macrolide efflux protein